MMDNPQRTNLIWLAGFLDGEGSFGLNRVSKSVKGGMYVPAIQVASTDPNAILKIIDILKENDITHYINSYMSLAYRNAKPAYSVRLGRLSQVKALIDLLMPYLIVKNRQAEILLRYVNLRISKGARPGSSIGLEFGQEEHDCFEQLKELNRKGLPQAIRKTPDRVIIYQGEDMVGPTAKAAGISV